MLSALIYIFLSAETLMGIMLWVNIICIYLWFIAVIRVGFDPVMYTVSETEGVVTVCISAMDTLTEGTLSVTLTTESGTASGMFIEDTCFIWFNVIVTLKD